MKKLLTLLSFGLLTLIVSSCCNFQPQEGDIRVPLGPEDIALHRSQSAEVTLLASCGGRRSKSSAAGAIVEIHPETLSSRIVYQGSQGSPFFPQGLSVINSLSSIMLLKTGLKCWSSLETGRAIFA
jgi:hypothetical protein